MLIGVTIHGQNVFTPITESKWGRILIPAIVFQSVSIGGGFSTGREVVQYTARHGTLGVLAIGIYLLSLSISGALIYEFSRQFNLYDYKSLMKNLLWKFWPVFEIVYITLAVVLIAVVASAGGELMNQILGIPIFASNVILIGFVFFVLYFGREAIEQFSVVGTVFIYAVYFGMFGFVLLNNGGEAFDTLMSGTTAYVDDPSLQMVAQDALIYAGYSLVGFIPPLFLLDRLETRTEAVTSGILSAVMLVIPLSLSYLSVLAYYPNESIMGAAVPWLAILESANPILLALYGIAIGWTLTESGVGFVHSIIERISENIKQSDYRLLADKDGLTAIQRGGLGFTLLLSAIFLSRIGIIALVNQVYPILAVLFTAVLIVPLITVGVYRMANPSWQKDIWTDSHRETQQTSQMDKTD